MAKKLDLVDTELTDMTQQSIIRLTSPTGPAIKGEAATNEQWECGSCGRVLLEDLAPGQVTAVVVLCSCGAYNDATI
jgi:hypothetical protein